jgi:hypothetical protein
LKKSSCITVVGRTVGVSVLVISAKTGHLGTGTQMLDCFALHCAKNPLKWDRANRLFPVIGPGLSSLVLNH